METYSGNSIPNSAIYSTNSLYITFTTDASITAKGFQASYSMVNSSTKNKLITFWSANLVNNLHHSVDLPY